MIYQVGGTEEQSGASMFCPPGEAFPFEYDIETADDFELYAISANDDVTVWAKANPGDAFQNIVTTPIPLDGFSPARRKFFFELRVDAAIVLDEDVQFAFPEIIVARPA